MEDNNNYRKQIIEKYVDIIYNNPKINYLFDEPISSFKQYALDLFLDTDLTVDQIADGFKDITEQRLKLYNEKKNVEKREQDIRNIVATVYNENPGVFYNSLENMQRDYVELYLNNPVVTIEDIGFRLRQTASELKEREMKKKKTTTEVETQPVIETQPIVDTQPVVEEVQVTSDEINTMLADVPKQEEITIVKENEKPKEFVKKNESNQSGSVSIFAIGVAILSIIAFILVAMILNVLLK